MGRPALRIQENHATGPARPAGRSRRAWSLPLVLAGAAVLLSGCSTEVQRGFLPSNPGMTNQTGRIMSLWNGSWIAALLTGVLVWGLILWAVVVYRRRRDDTGLPAQIRYNIPLEILYTVVPLIMVGVLFYYTARDQAAIASVATKPDITVNVVGKQWGWDFNYIEQGGKRLDVYDTGVQVQDTGAPGAEAQAPVLYLPVNQRVQFQLTSRDVAHSFWIPAFLYKMDVIPGVENRFQVIPQQIGEYRGKCAELCGEYHYQMLFKVRVVSQADFDKHVADLRALGQTGQLSSNLGRSQTPDRPGGAVPGTRPGGNDGTGNN
jgi:cytochrome c oxidase subunit 2